MRSSSPQLPISIAPLPCKQLLAPGSSATAATLSRERVASRNFTCASPWVAPGSCLLPPASWLLAPGSCLLPPASCLLPPASWSRDHAGALPILSGASGIEEGLVT